MGEHIEAIAMNYFGLMQSRDGRPEETLFGVDTAAPASPGNSR
jgi:hypothetical protein